MYDHLDYKINSGMIYNHWNMRMSIRSKQSRLDQEGKLYDVSSQYPAIAKDLANSLKKWEKEVVSELKINDQDNRPFPVGHPVFRYTQLPARDGVPHGRSLMLKISVLLR